MFKIPAFFSTAILGVFLLAANATPAQAQVGIGVTVAPPVYPYPYAYAAPAAPYCDPYVNPYCYYGGYYPYYGYPYFVGFGYLGGAIIRIGVITVIAAAMDMGALATVTGVPVDIMGEQRADTLIAAAGLQAEGRMVAALGKKQAASRAVAVVCARRWRRTPLNLN